MRELTVADVMTRQVITAVPDTTFRELVGTMIVHGLDALPVIDHSGRPIGVVAEADTLTKLEFHGGADQAPLFAGTRRRNRWYKAHGLTAADLMTRPALTVIDDSTLDRAVHAMADHGVRRLYVVEHTGHLVGVLTRHDALRLFLRSDSAILADIERAILGKATRTRRLTVRVTDGIVTLDGTLALHSAVERAKIITSRVPGVIAVHNNLRYDLDDLMITGL
ncbi:MULTISPECIES: CBS domain-containing protein [Pseudonocardiaceae]|uniref:Uncharacterized protein n=2 Tax=Pseudonocardiaceae TaxID=2070 RepID=A0A2V4ACP1_9PSEU|nr:MULTISPECIES: CBS domain-containing protein [Pseudonocardiaceae]PXY17006.1 hypothetical protein BAY60_34980 [Prauserella muralis]TWE23657.1 BON domain-containing protein [Prauserella muralis]WIV57955.1 CBS domain-containing protein [Amycolatopsis sp. 2-2]